MRLTFALVLNTTAQQQLSKMRDHLALKTNNAVGNIAQTRRELGWLFSALYHV